MNPDPSSLLKEKYEPEAWAIPYHKARTWARTRVAAGGTGSGKTHANTYEFIRLGYEYPGEWMGIADTRDNSYELQFRKVLSMINDELIVDVKQSPQMVILIQAINGKITRMRFQGTDEGSVKAERKKRGPDLQGVWSTEASNITLEVDNQMNLRTRSAKPMGFYLYDSNPEDPKHHLIKNYFPRDKNDNVLKMPQLNIDSHWIEGRVTDELNRVYWQSLTIHHNSHLTEGEVKAILKRYPKGTVWYDRMVLGRWVTKEGAVWDRPLEDYAMEVEYA